MKLQHCNWRLFGMPVWLDTSEAQPGAMRLARQFWEEAMLEQRAAVRLDVDHLAKRVAHLNALRQRAITLFESRLPDDPRVQEWLTDAGEF